MPKYETYLEKAEKFIKEDGSLTGKNHIVNSVIRGIEMFACYLDSQEKSGTKEKIEKLDINKLGNVGDSDLAHKINDLIDFLNAEK